MSLENLITILIIVIGIVMVMIAIWFVLTMYLRMNESHNNNEAVDITPQAQVPSQMIRPEPTPAQNVAAKTSLLRKSDLVQRMPNEGSANEEPPVQPGIRLQWPRANKAQNSDEVSTSKVPTRTKRKSDTGDLRPPSTSSKKPKWTGLGTDWDE